MSQPAPIARGTRIFSGIQPSGELHIGNYLGAVQKWVALQDDYDCIFCVVDYHAVTQPFDPKAMPTQTIEAARDFLACGIDPARSKVFVQSSRPEHLELAWIFGTLTPMGALQRMTQFKDKGGEDSRLGLFAYPVLQAADILLYKADAVPVGEDQAQHLELTREIARKFNNAFADRGHPIFPEPRTLLSETPRVLGLDGKKKMSKSLGNHIALGDPPETVRKKLSAAFTDPARLRRKDPGNPEICNIFSLHRSFSSSYDVARIKEQCPQAAIGCVDCKRMLGARIDELLAPIQEKRKALTDDTIREILATGAEDLAPTAKATIDEARQAMGIGLS